MRVLTFCSVSLRTSLIEKHSHCSIVGWVVWGLFICSQVQMPFGVVGMLAWRKRLRQIHLKAVWLGFPSHTSPESFTIRLSHYASPKDDPDNKSITFKSSIFGTFRITLRKIWQASVEMCCITIPKAPAQSNSFCSTYGSRTVWNTSLFFTDIATLELLTTHPMPRVPNPLPRWLWAALSSASPRRPPSVSSIDLLQLPDLLASPNWGPQWDSLHHFPQPVASQHLMGWHQAIRSYIINLTCKAGRQRGFQ